MFKLIGALVGFVLGDRVHEGFMVTLLLAAIGLAIGAIVDRRRMRTAGAVASDPNARLVAVERRLDALERALAVPGPATVTAPVQPAPVDTVATREWIATPVVTLDDAAVPPRPAYGVRSAEVESSSAPAAAIATQAMVAP